MLDGHIIRKESSRGIAHLLMAMGNADAPRLEN